MFRPVPETSLFRTIPFRLIAPVLVIVALALVVILFFSLEHQRLMVLGLTQDKAPSSGPFSSVWQSRRDLIAVTALLFLMSGICSVAVIAFLHYSTTRRTLEEVKGLARNILKSIPTGVLTVDCDGLITTINPSAEKIVRRQAAELLGHSYDTAFGEGDTIRIVLDGALRRHDHVDHQDLSLENREGARMIRTTTADLTDERGESTGVLLLIKDVTELLTLEQHLRSTEKLAGLHTLSAGVAHELRNPLSAIDLNLGLLEEELRQAAVSAKASQYLQVLNAESRRLAHILDNFLRFARPGSVHLDEMDIRGVVGHIISLLQYEAEERRVRLEAQIEADLAPIVGDETQISQVLVNIVVNAFQAMPDGGVCRINVAVQHLDDNDWIEISVEDTGVGIKPEELPRLFEPFYTTKAGGSGLGLAIAYRIVEDHGGRIQILSAPGTGTRVITRLPAAAHQQSLVRNE
jgi:PAS domain S-box-containing protein